MSESAAKRQECDGSSECKAEEHVHGCFADEGNCDEPQEHRLATKGAPGTTDTYNQGSSGYAAAFASSGDSMIDAYRIKIKRLTEQLTWIADPIYVGDYSDAEIVEIYRKWAKDALA